MLLAAPAQAHPSNGHNAHPEPASLETATRQTAPTQPRASVPSFLETVSQTVSEIFSQTVSQTLLPAIQRVPQDSAAPPSPSPADLIAQAYQNQVQIDIRDGYRYITSNGIPDHVTGTFPNAGNPNRISPQSHTFRVTLTPENTGVATQVRPTFGVALNGVPFEPGTGEFWNRDRSWNYDALSGMIDLGTDANNAHVQPTGSYHYHGLPTSLVSNAAMTLLGYAADGFPIYGPYGYSNANDPSSGLVELHSSYQLKAGQRPDGPGGTYDGTFTADFEYTDGAGDLDPCNGRFGVTPEHPEGIYHYYVTTMFPFVPRCVMGTPDDSFVRRAQGGGGPGGGSGGGSGRGSGSGSGSGSGGRRRPDGPPPSGRSSSGRPEGPPPRSSF